MQDIPDSELLRRFRHNESDEAFSELVRRHINLVYSVALRHTENAHHAQEITQAVFIILVRKAASLGHETVLSGWLYHTARLTAANFRRAEICHARREQEAYVQSTLEESSPDAVWRELAPFLDEAMSHLDPTDRDAVVLRYFENQDLRAVGTALGISDDAAQKRVSRAIERLREFFTKRGVTVGASGLAVAITANAIQAAPVGLAATIATAGALVGTTLVATTTATATKAIVMTTLQKAIIATTILASVGTGVYESRQASHLRAHIQTLQQQQAEQIKQLQSERSDAANRLSALVDEIERVKGSSTELLKLRGEVTRLRTAASDPMNSAAKSLLERVDKLKQKLEETPNAKIPELQFLTDADWIEATKGNLDSEADYRKAFSYLRAAGEKYFLNSMQAALQKYLKANNEQFPTDLSQLKPYFDSPPGDDILQRYQIVSRDSVPFESNTENGDRIITQKTVVDEDNDAQFTLGRNSLGSATFQFAQAYKILVPAIQALTAAAPTNNNGGTSFNISQLLPYLTTPEQKAAYHKLTHQVNRDSH